MKSEGVALCDPRQAPQTNRRGLYGRESVGLIHSHKFFKIFFYLSRMNFIVSLSIYPYDVMFSVGQSDKAFKKSCKAVLRKEYYVDLLDDMICTSEESLRGRTFHHLIGGQTIIRIPKWEGTPAQMGTLVHEILHAVDFIFRRIQIPLIPGTEEVYVYAIGYLTEQFYIELAKH